MLAMSSRGRSPRKLILVPSAVIRVPALGPLVRLASIGITTVTSAVPPGRNKGLRGILVTRIRRPLSKPHSL